MPFSILLPYQQRIFASKSDKIICCCSRQIGKSFVAMGKAVYQAIMQPGSTTICISTGERAARELLLKGKNWAEACLACATPETAPYLQYSASATEIKFGNGSRIMILPSGNPAALRGFTGNLILDEFAIVENDAEVWGAIVPTLTSKIANPNKTIAIYSTPTGLNTIFAKLWQSDESLGWEKYKLTIEDAFAEGLPVDIEGLKNLVNDDYIWRTEYECEFASTADTAFKIEWLRDIGENYTYDPSLPCSIGVDVARTSDYTVFVVLQQTPDGVYHVVELIQLKNVPFDEQLEKLKETVKKYRIKGGYIDNTGIGAMFAEEAAKKISSRLKPFTFSAKSKTEILERLRKALAGVAVKVPNEDVGVIQDDLSQMRRLLDGNGIHYTAPHTKSGHADIACALALAIGADHDVYVTDALPQAARTTSGQWGCNFDRLR